MKAPVRDSAGEMKTYDFEKDEREREREREMRLSSKGAVTGREDRI